MVGLESKIQYTIMDKKMISTNVVRNREGLTCMSKGTAKNHCFGRLHYGREVKGRCASQVIWRGVAENISFRSGCKCLINTDSKSKILSLWWAWPMILKESYWIVWDLEMQWSLMLEWAGLVTFIPVRKEMPRCSHMRSCRHLVPNVSIKDIHHDTSRYLGPSTDY